MKQAKPTTYEEAKVTENDAQYALDLVKVICAEVGPGLPGTPQERERADIIKKELVSHLGADNVAAEEFTFAPGPFLDSYRIGAVFTLIAAILSISQGIFVPIASLSIAITALAFSVITVLVFFIEFFFDLEVIDPLFKKKKSINVVGRLRKTQKTEVKRLLIFSGHHDSALEFTWLRLFGYGFLVVAVTIILGFIAMLAITITQLVGLISSNIGLVHLGTLEWVLLVYPVLPSIVFALFFAGGRKNGGNVPGAADNLSGATLTVALCRFLVKNPLYIPVDTEIRFISFGSEEAGLRGSRRYVKNHLEELKRLHTRLLNFETVAYPEIIVLSSDVNGIVKHSPEIVKSVAMAAEHAQVPFRVKPASSGVGTDAAPFSRAGIDATSLLPFKIPQQLVAFYHQKRDKPEVLTLEPLLNALKVSVEWLRRDDAT
jgi:aminopeptidase YwaD